jgi:hypothetical protein
VGRQGEVHEKAAAVLIGEVIRAEHRGKAVGAMQSAWPVGWGMQPKDELADIKQRNARSRLG